jgi:hypothetical protein
VKPKNIDINTLQTLRNYAVGQGVTPGYIYKLERDGKMETLLIDGVKFIQIDRYPSIPVINRRK